MHLIVGAGVIGSTIARRLAEAGEQVRIVTRTGSGPTHDNIERIAADASDSATMRRLATGAVAVYNCVNPPYHRWPTEWPPIAEALLAAAEVSGAPLVITGNLYGYGPVDGPMTEHTPLLPTTVKGRVRAEMWQDALAACRSGRISGVTEVRASDFIGPKHSLLEFSLPAMTAGKSFWLPGPLDVPHSFTYTGDLVHAMITLVRDPRAWGRGWHVPSPAPMTLRQMVNRVADLEGFPRPRPHTLPKTVIRAAGIFDGWARGFVEMRYQFERPFVLEAPLTEETFGLRATDLDTALRASVAAWRATSATVNPRPATARTTTSHA